MSRFRQFENAAVITSQGGVAAKGSGGICQACADDWPASFVYQGGIYCHRRRVRLKNQ